MKILNIQGSRREQDENGNIIPFEPTDKLEVLNKHGEVFNPEVRWYSNPNLYKLTSDIIEKEGIDCIVGHSAGGFLAFYLSNFYKIPCFLINPAVARNSQAPTLQQLPDDVKNASIFNKQMIVIGNRDLKKRGGVDFNLVLEFFQGKGFFKFGTNKMYLEDGMSHSIPLDVFEKYFQQFLKLYF